MLGFSIVKILDLHCFLVKDCWINPTIPTPSKSFRLPEEYI